MSLGIVMLAHTALDRAEAVARHWSQAGSPVVIHVDRRVPKPRFDAFVSALGDRADVLFSRRHRCEWGTWGLVAASQDAAELMLERFGDVQHVCLTSGACLPLRPVAELAAYLKDRAGTDFIESTTTADARWTVGGLDTERFSLYFPFSWRRRRALFDASVELQRALRVSRRAPGGLVPHLGSQWWCLSRPTLTAILSDPDRPRQERYFRRVWIPDESYFQTLARRWSRDIESRSLTLSKFDFQGKPHLFYDDHLPLLRRSDAFIARKIWPRADRLYSTFLTDSGCAPRHEPRDPGQVDRVFAQAVARRTRGRPGLLMQSRFPNPGWENGVTAAGYSVFQGCAELFEDFESWVARHSGMRVHGRLFAPQGAEFAGGGRVFDGALSAHPGPRDANPGAFLANLVRTTRGQRQCFQYGPEDGQDMLRFVSRDPNAQISVVTGAWLVPLFAGNRDLATIRSRAASLQRTEHAMLETLRSHDTRATVRVWTMAEFLRAPMAALQAILDEVAESPLGLTEAPRLRDLSGFGRFLQELRNAGMHPSLAGAFAVDPEPAAARPAQPKPYIVQS